MTSTTFFIFFIPVLAIILLAVNLILAPHNPYQEKDSAFECGFHSFLGQNRTQFSISFFIFALLFLLFDLEILLVYPFSVSGYNNDLYGLVIMLVFFVALTLGFVFELGKNALVIESKQTLSDVTELSNPEAYIGDSVLQSNILISIFTSKYRIIWFYLGYVIIYSLLLYILSDSRTCYVEAETTAEWRALFDRLDHLLRNAEVERVRSEAPSNQFTLNDIGIRFRNGYVTGWKVDPVLNSLDSLTKEPGYKDAVDQGVKSPGGVKVVYVLQYIMSTRQI